MEGSRTYFITQQQSQPYKTKNIVTFGIAAQWAAIPKWTMFKAFDKLVPTKDEVPDDTVTGGVSLQDCQEDEDQRRRFMTKNHSTLPW